jgi:outer membrane murein-binding lipoprotein Lpp
MMAAAAIHRVIVVHLCENRIELDQHSSRVYTLTVRVELALDIIIYFLDDGGQPSSNTALL